MDAWSGIILAMKAGNRTEVLQPYVENIFTLLNTVWLDQNKSEPLLRSAMGVIGDLAESFPGGEISPYYRADWLMAMVKETRSNRDFRDRTKDTAKWAREQVKRQINMGIQQT